MKTKLQALKNAEVVYDQELELYNEVVRLREIINKANLFIETYLNNVDDIDVNMQVVKDILKQSNYARR